MTSGKVTFTASVSRTPIHMRTMSYMQQYNYANVYKNRMGLSPVSFQVKQEGSFPTGKYKITDVKIEVGAESVAGMPFQLQFFGYNASKTEIPLGSVAYDGRSQYGKSATATQSNLNKEVPYEGIKEIVIQTEESSAWLVGGKFTMTVAWQEVAPVVYVAKIKDPVVITGVKESKGIEGEARNTQLKVTIEGVDISESINKYLLGMTYVDNEEDATDDLQIRMHDKDSLWLTKWLDEMIQTAAQARYSRTNSQTTSTVIKDSASNYGTLNMVAYTSNGYEGYDEETYQYFSYIRRYDKQANREYDVVRLKQYLKLLGYYKDGELNSAINKELSTAVSECLRNAGRGFYGSFDNGHWTWLINQVNGKTDTNYAVVFTAMKKFNLLSEASTSSAKLAEVEPRTEVAIIGKSGANWYLAEYGGQRGYIQNTTDSLSFSSVKKITTSTSKISTKGLKIQAGIILRTPDGKQRTLNCGEFTLDTVGASGPPSSVVLKATAAPYANGVRTEQRDKAWTKYTLSKIGQEIAKKAGLGYLFDSEKDPTYSRVEQTKQTDLAFLMDLCHRNGCSLKVTDHRLVIFEQSRYEKMEAAATVTFMDGSYTSYNLSTQEGENHYTGCIVRYYNPNTKQIYTATVLADDADTSKDDGNYLTVTNEPVNSNDEAKALANARLRLANKFEKKVSLTMLGNPDLAAGLPMRLKGFGMFDGKYTIRQAKHEVGSGGYTTQVTLRAIPDVTASKGTLKSVTEELAKKIAVPVEPKENTGTEFMANKATGLYRDAASYRNGNVRNVVSGVSEGTTLTILGKVRNGTVKVATNTRISSAYVCKSGYIRADAIERK